MKVRTYGRRLSSLGIVGTLLAALLVVLAPSPAQAGTCGTPGCGGSVRNALSVVVPVTNCWHDTSGSYAGALPPCATNGFSTSKWNAYAFVQPGSDSTNISSYYYDVDAFMAIAGCVTTGYYRSGGSIFIDRRGKSALWQRVYGTEKAFVTGQTC